MTEFQSSLFALGVTLLLLLVVVALYYVYWSLNKRISLSRRQRKLERLLRGRDLRAALDSAPYIYGHSQGEDGYRITVRSQGPKPVAWATTELGAQIWILEHALDQEKQRPQ